jgi:hypothetical protein
MSKNPRHLIVWQKWIDPFIGEEDDTIEPKDNLDKSYEDDDILPNEIESIIQEEFAQQSKQQIKVIATPMGMIPVNEHTASGKIFNFWTGHTNFNITKNISNIIESIDGVETLDIFTRYRFRIAIGKLFNNGEVMNKISNEVYSYLE